MDGDVAPLDVIGALCEKYNAMLMIDECHATGFMGPNGRGIEELQNCEGVSTVINSTVRSQILVRFRNLVIFTPKTSTITKFRSWTKKF